MVQVKRAIGLAAAMLAALLAAAPLPAQAQEPAANPALTALVDGVDDESSRSVALRIEHMKIAVRLHGTIAETALTARLRNTGPDRLEGRFALAMPAQSVVTGYALDVQGVMVDGVLLDQIAARRAYEARVRERIDPGLGEVSRDFTFETRIYPIEAGGTRTVRLRFVTPLDPKEGYRLPLSHPHPIGSLSLSIEASGLAAAPSFVLPVAAAPAWQHGQGVWRVAHGAQEARIDGVLSIAPPRRAAPMLASEGDNGPWFEIADSFEGPARPAAPPRSVAILWDRSLSRGDDLVGEELALVLAWLKRVKPERIELILFDGGAAGRETVAGADALKRRLEGLAYRGATSIEPLAALPIRADACLLFTDGLVTIGRRPPLRPDCPMSIVSSAADADRAWLGAVARQAGGEAMQLTAANRDALLDRLTRAPVRVADVRGAAGERIDFTLLDAPAGGWRIVGPMPAGGSVLVRLAGLPEGSAERLYTQADQRAAFRGAEALWAADRLAVRIAQGEESRDAILAFARRHSVAGPEISFLVLETPEDYVESDIAPPDSYPADRRALYDALVRDRRKEEQAEEKARFEDLLERWEERKQWWRTRFDPYARGKKGETGSGEEQMVPVPIPVPVPSPPPPPPSQPPGAEDIVVIDLPPAEVVISGNRIRAPAIESVTVHGLVGNEPPSLPQASGATQQPEIAPAEWAPDRPYLAALKAARAKDRPRVLAEQQALHGTLPAFWLDVAEYYRRAGEREEALRLLLSALDLPTRDNETLAIVAGRLSRQGELDRAIELFERLVAAEPDRPQPLRSLALALAQRARSAPREQARADLGRAVALLTRLVMSDIPGAYEGIDLVALMEVNRLIVLYRAAGGTDVPLDPRLIALLDLDLRIVVEWNTESTDLDLWVIEPNGERAYYGNELTAIGGAMSEDMMDGYGPEEYVLRRAPAGTFRVRADVYADDPINPNGPSRIFARIIRDFGRPSEREEIVEVELPPEGDGEEGEDEASLPLATVRIRR